MSAEPWASSPVWFRRPAVLHAGTAVLIVLSASTEFVRIVADRAGVVAFAALLVTVAGAALARWRPWPGLVLAAAGCLISALAGWDPIVMWSITVFALFSLTLEGLPAVRGTVFVGAALYLVTAIAQDYDFGPPYGRCWSRRSASSSCSDAALTKTRRPNPRPSSAACLS